MKKHSLIPAGMLLCVLAALSIFSTSCDSIPAVLEDPKAQYVIDTAMEFKNKQSPDDEVTDYNIATDPGPAGDFYRNNKDKIKSAEVSQFAFAIDTVILDPARDPALSRDIEAIKNIQIDKLTFLVQTRPGPGLPWSTVQEIGTFNNVKFGTYWKFPQIVSVPEATGKSIGEALRNYPEFRVIQRYGNANTGSGFFRSIKGRFQMSLRFTLQL
jgi:hypothetical protein